MMTNNENVTVLAVAMTTTSIERPHHQIETRLSTPVAVPEPLPDWERAKEIWHHWWPLHVYMFGALFSVCGLLSMGIVVRVTLAHHGGPQRRQRVALATALCLVCLFRSIYLLVDAYHSISRLPPVVTQLLNGLAYPSLIGAMVMSNRLLSALIDSPSSLPDSPQMSPRHRKTILSPTTKATLAMYVIATTVLYPVATLVPGARASVLIVEATFATWGFTQSFVAGGRCFDLRLVARRARDARQRLVDYVRLKRRLAAEAESGRPATRCELQRLKRLRRQWELISSSATHTPACQPHRRRQQMDSVACRAATPSDGNRHSHWDSSSSSSLSSTVCDMVDGEQGMSSSAVARSPKTKMTSSEKATDSKSGFSHPANLPVWSATASVVSGGTALQTTSSEYHREESAAACGFEIESSASDELARDETVESLRKLRTSTKIIDAMTKIIDDGVRFNCTTMTPQRNEPFSVRLCGRRDRKRKYTSPNWSIRRSNCQARDSQSELFPVLTSFDVETLSGDDFYGSDAEHTTSGCKSLATLTSPLSTTETLLSISDSQRIDRNALLTESGDSDISGSPKSIISNGRRCHHTVTGSPGYAADTELEHSTSATAADESSKPATACGWKWSSLIDIVLSRRPRHHAPTSGRSFPTSGHADDEYDNSFDTDDVTVKISSTDPQFTVPQMTTRPPGRRRRRTRLTEVVLLRKAVIVSCLSVSVELALSAVQIYATLGVFGILSNTRTVVSLWSWLVFQTVRRLFEALFVLTSLALVLVTSTGHGSCRRKPDGHLLKNGLTSSSRRTRNDPFCNFRMLPTSSQALLTCSR